jgi:hypothetical protein
MVVLECELPPHPTPKANAKANAKALLQFLIFPLVTLDSVIELSPP